MDLRSSMQAAPKSRLLRTAWIHRRTLPMLPLTRALTASLSAKPQQGVSQKSRMKLSWSCWSGGHRGPWLALPGWQQTSATTLLRPKRVRRGRERARQVLLLTHIKLSTCLSCGCRQLCTSASLCQPPMMHACRQTTNLRAHICVSVLRILRHAWQAP